MDMKDIVEAYLWECRKYPKALNLFEIALDKLHKANRVYKGGVPEYKVNVSIREYVTACGYAKNSVISARRSLNLLVSRGRIFHCEDGNGVGMSLIIGWTMPNEEEKSMEIAFNPDFVKWALGRNFLKK